MGFGACLGGDHLDYANQGKPWAPQVTPFPSQRVLGVVRCVQSNDSIHVHCPLLAENMIRSATSSSGCL